MDNVKVINGMSKGQKLCIFLGGQGGQIQSSHTLTRRTQNRQGQGKTPDNFASKNDSFSRQENYNFQVYDGMQHVKTQ